MATIQTINSADNGADSLAKINSNLANLNTDKLEIDSTVTLTNKTIDADSNTISNLELDNFKSTAKTGADTKMVTGTAGTSDNLVKWNDDNDAVDAGVAVSTDTLLGGVSPVDTKIPTEQAVKTYVDTKVGTKSAFFECVQGSGGSWPASTNLFGYLTNSVNDKGFISFYAPQEFDQTNFTAKLLISSNNATVASTATFTLSTTFASTSANETYNLHVDSQTITTGALDQLDLEELDVTDAFTLLAAGDSGRCQINIDSISGGSYTYYIRGIVFEW